MDKDLLKGIKHGTGILLVFLLAFSVYAVGFHQTSELVPGIFQGDYSFNGSLGIGNSPDKKLDVVGKTSLYGGDNNSARSVISIGQKNSSETYVYIGSDANNSYGWLGAWKQGKGGEDLVINGNGGKVGIGTTNPNSTLDVNGKIKSGNLQIKHNSGTNSVINLDAVNPDGSPDWTELFFSHNNSKKWRIRKDSSNDFDIHSDDVDASVLHISNNTGNIGIGTISPDTKLDIDGGLQVGSYSIIPVKEVSASNTQAREREIANLVIDENDWSNTNGFILEAHSDYYDSGYKKYYIEAGYGTISANKLRSLGSVNSEFGLRIEKAEMVKSESDGGDHYRYRIHAQADRYTHWRVFIKEAPMNIKINEDVSNQGELGIKTSSSYTDISSLSNT